MGGILIAFKKYNYAKGIFGSPFVGLKTLNFYLQQKKHGRLPEIHWCTILFSLCLNCISHCGCNSFEWNTIKNGKKVYQTVILIPFLISIVVVSYLVYGFLSTDAGFINNSILNAMGKEGIGWYSEPKYWPGILIFVNIWKNLGYNCIIYYATVVGLDTSLYESAAIDGANRWQKILHVTLPGLKPTIITLTLMSVGRIFYSDFGLFTRCLWTAVTLIDVTNTIDTYVYRGLMELNNIGMASAAGLYQSLVGFALVLIANLIVRKLDKSSALF